MDDRLNILDTLINKKKYDSLWFSLDGGFLEKSTKKRKNLINIKTKIDTLSESPVNICVDFYNQQGGELNKILDKCKILNYSVDEIKKSNYKLEFSKIDKFCRLANNNLLKSKNYNITSIDSNKLVPISNFSQSGGFTDEENLTPLNNGVLPGKSNLDGAGTGVFATKDFNIGDIVEITPILPIPIKDTADNILNDYVFMYDGSNHGMALGYGGVYNHQNKPNIDYSYTNDKKCMIYKTNKNIKKGDELFVSYGLGWWLYRKLTPVDIE